METDKNVTVVDYEQVETRAHEVEKEALTLLNSAETFTITTNEQYESSADLLRRIKAKGNALRDLRLGMTRPLDEAKARIMDLFRPTGDKLDEAERVLKKGMLTFTQEQEVERRRIEAAAREEAAKEAERLQRRADNARASGKEDKADMLEDQAAAVPVPIVASQVTKVSGVSMRETWHAEMVDLELLVLAVATKKAPLACLMPNMPILNAQARSLKLEMNIPGVRAVQEDIVAARGKS